MPDYLTYAEITATLPASVVEGLLDDTGSGAPAPNGWSAVLARVTTAINGKVGQRYALPLAEPLPDSLKDAAFVLAAELLFQRKNFFGDANPWTDRAREVRKFLDAVALGEQPLAPTLKRQQPSVSVVTEPAKTTPATGSLLA